jgi:DNA-directed RNA polymerase specialized sigma24 family protein
LRAWLFQITRHALIDHQRARTKRKTEELPETIAAESTDPILERIRTSRKFFAKLSGC